MNKYNEQRNPHGPWKRYCSNGNLWYKGNYINGKQHGPCEWYWCNGQLIEIEYYIT